jgi:dTDP-4-amino-4,6-dideoxygalactose transaminase
MMPPKKLVLAGARPLFPEEDLPGILEEIADVLRGGRLILGPRTRELEAEWAERAGTRHAVALSSCTAALEIAYRYAKVAGREVIVPTNTFVATANAAAQNGARVVFCDIDARDHNLDVADAIDRITGRTAAICVVHIGGFVPHDLDRLRDLCRRNRILLVEDCAHAMGATAGGRPVGSLGDAGCFSLYPTKILTSGVGGVLTTDRDDLAQLARSLRHHGQGASLEEIVHAGNDWLMDEVRAVLARAQLRRLDDFLARRRAVATRYDELLASRDRYAVLRAAPGTVPAYYKYPIVLPLGVDRDAVKNALLARHGIECGAIYSPPAHLMPVFQGEGGVAPARLPVAESLLARQLCLPMHAALVPEDADRAMAALDEVVAPFFK